MILRILHDSPNSKWDWCAFQNNASGCHWPVPARWSKIGCLIHNHSKRPNNRRAKHLGVHVKNWAFGLALSWTNGVRRKIWFGASPLLYVGSRTCTFHSLTSKQNPRSFLPRLKTSFPGAPGCSPVRPKTFEHSASTSSRIRSNAMARKSMEKGRNSADFGWDLDRFSLKLWWKNSSFQTWYCRIECASLFQWTI